MFPVEQALILPQASFQGQDKMSHSFSKVPTKPAINTWKIF